MTKLEELRATVSKMFENATEKEVIEQLAKVNNAIDEVQNEQEQLVSKNGELIKSYKELVKHTSFKEQPAAGSTNPAVSTPSFEEALNQFLASNKEN